MRPWFGSETDPLASSRRAFLGCSCGTAPRTPLTPPSRSSYFARPADSNSYSQQGITIDRANTHRLPGLDLLRAIAISWVMLYHASLYGLASAGSRVVGFGSMGVDLFFVLSGFLIASQLLRPWARGSTPDYRRFFVRRLFRTIPAYVAVLAIYFLIPAARDRDHIQPLWTFLTFTQNFTIDPTTANAFRRRGHFSWKNSSTWSSRLRWYFSGSGPRR